MKNSHQIIGESLQSCLVWKKRGLSRLILESVGTGFTKSDYELKKLL